MNVSSQMLRKDSVPICFGKEWDPSVTDCTGGPDPKYVHPINGTHVKERCDFYAQCGARVQAARIGAPLLQASSLVRPPSPGPIQPSFQQYMQREAQEKAAQQQRAMHPTGFPAYPQQTHYLQQQPQHPMHYPASAYQLNYMMPPYLSVAEPVEAGGSFFGMLGREVLRALGKSAGHTISHFFDTRPLRLPPRDSQ